MSTLAIEELTTRERWTSLSRANDAARTRVVGVAKALIDEWHARRALSAELIRRLDMLALEVDNLEITYEEIEKFREERNG